MRKIKEIFRLSMDCGIKKREIARSCAVAHTTVNDYINRAKEAGLTWSEIREMDEGKLKGLLGGGRKTTKSDNLRPRPDWEQIHQEVRKPGVTLQLLWQEYKALYPDGYQLSQFYERYSQWKKKQQLSLRQTHKAGEKLFVDYAGQTVPVIDRGTGEVKTAQIFVGVLGASNHTYAEATATQGIPDWIGSHIRAFEYFGGVPEIVVPDNLKSGVTKACRYEPDINTTYHEMAVHYGTAIIPARVRKPKDKAKAEVGVQIVERWILAALRNREFFSIRELNEAISELLERLNNRPFKKLKGTRRSCFEEIEKAALKPLPCTPYEIAEWKKARVNIDYHVELMKHYYSVPYRLVREEVELRYTPTTVEIFYKGKRVASHRRDDQPGRHTTIKEHMPKSHREYQEWTPSRIINWAATIGESTAQVVATVMDSRRHPEQGYRSCLGIMRLGKRYGNDRLEAASKRAVAIRGCSYKSIESILKNGLDSQPTAEKESGHKPVDHENIRGREYYH